VRWKRKRKRKRKSNPRPRHKLRAWGNLRVGRGRGDEKGYLREKGKPEGGWGRLRGSLGVC
jgi:hypothetical protein